MFSAKKCLAPSTASRCVATITRKSPAATHSLRHFHGWEIWDEELDLSKHDLILKKLNRLQGARTVLARFGLWLRPNKWTYITVLYDSSTVSTSGKTTRGYAVSQLPNAVLLPR